MASNPSVIYNEREELLQEFQTFDLEENLYESEIDFQTFELKEDLHQSLSSKFPNYRLDIEKEIEEEEQSIRISKKKRRPDDFIEGVPEPKVHTYIKSLRNTIPVPSHWSREEEYLHGVANPAYQLPDFISEKKLEERRREYVEMDMAPLKVEMHVLHDAFFKYQRKPKLSGYGELYYEGKEVRAAAEMKKPGKAHWGDLHKDEDEF